MSEQLKKYRQRPVEVMAFRWEPKLGAINGVKVKPKQHRLNPDEFYLLDRNRKEVILKEPCWITTKNDGSHDVIQDGQFLELWELVDKAPKSKPKESSSPVSPPKEDSNQEEKPEVLKQAEAKKSKAKK